MKILIVDDDPDVRITTCMLLEHFGHVLHTASNGAEALHVVEQLVPDVILLDLNMPVMDGFTAARKLRQLPAAAAVLIVAVSGYVSNKEWCDRARAAGVDECLVKPLDYERLNSLLRDRGNTNH